MIVEDDDDPAAQLEAALQRRRLALLLGVPAAVAVVLLVAVLYGWTKPGAASPPPRSRPRPSTPVSHAEPGPLAQHLRLRVVPGVGIEEKLKLCEPSSQIVGAFGRPTKVEEIDHIIDGLVDDYLYMRGDALWLGARVRKRDDKIIQIVVANGWTTDGELQSGSTELDMRRQFGRCSTQQGFLFEGDEFVCKGKKGRIFFGQGWPKVKVSDERGLPREAAPLTTARVSTGRCPLKGAGGTERTFGAPCRADAECASGWCNKLDEEEGAGGICDMLVE